MNLKFNGDQDLIRSIEEGSRLLLSEKKQDGTAVMTFSLEKAPEDASSSIVKKGDTCTVRFQEPAQYFRLFNYALHHNNEDFSLEEKPYFARRGFMLDCSRNAVANPEKLRSLVLMKCQSIPTSAPTGADTPGRNFGIWINTVPFSALSWSPVSRPWPISTVFSAGIIPGLCGIQETF